MAWLPLLLLLPSTGGAPFLLLWLIPFSCMITDVEYLSSPSAALFLLVTVLTVALSAILESRFTPPSPVPYLLLRV